VDLSNKISDAEFSKRKSSIKSIFFFRICGTGMGSAATLLKEKGFHVEGGDYIFRPPMDAYLKSTGIPLHDLNEIDINFLKEFDLIVVGNVVSGASEDARNIESLGVPFCSFPKALGEFVLSGANVIGISGTHGKTTTTYICTQLFSALGVDPGYLIGGVLEGLPSAKLGDGRYFFIESDEYDSAYFEKIAKFRNYHIDHLILTSLEYDHADIYDNLEQIKDEYRHLIPSVSKSFILSRDYQAIKELEEEFKEKVTLENCMHYGIEGEDGPRILEQATSSTVFSLVFKGEEITFKTGLVGYQNILNLSSAILFALSEGFAVADVQKATNHMELVKRRQEFRGMWGELKVIDDFAHHPRAIKMTIDAIRDRFVGERIICIFEPNSATARSSLHQNEYPDSFSLADEIIFTKPYAETSAKHLSSLDSSVVINKLREMGKVSTEVKDLTELNLYLNKIKESPAVLLVMSNGNCLGLWQSVFVNELS